MNPGELREEGFYFQTVDRKFMLCSRGKGRWGMKDQSGQRIKTIDRTEDQESYLMLLAVLAS